ncbi:hypothetical protein PVL29_011261 [Vitis rotundifolia]|uniref:cyclin-dependent kinase n=1 Tax=Vitis rotundifolia TaxID=103349 RepID=A0AA38ZPN8_VITRO|nr:hypothetical protein PVL29_011261 [Vitis rotundifolia]
MYEKSHNGKAIKACKDFKLKYPDIELVSKEEFFRDSHEAKTLWYRTPETLLGLGHHSTPVDVWFVGCIFAEMVNQQSLSHGDSETDELFKIFKVLGTPNQDTWTGMNSLIDFKSAFPKWSPKDLTTNIPNLKSACIDFLSRTQHLDPNRRRMRAMYQMRKASE